MKIEKNCQIIFDYLSSKNYTVYKIEGTSGYYSFKIRQINHHWRFGIWLYDKKDKMVPENKCNCESCIKNMETKEFLVAQVFAQYDKDIDKFKPSRSYYNTQITFNDLEKWDKDRGLEYNFLYELKDMIDEIKKYPFVARAHSYNSYNNNHINTFEALKICFKIDYNNIKEKFLNWKKHKIMLHKLRWYKLTGKIIKYSIKDRNTKDYIVFPRWAIKVLAKSKYADEVDNALEKLSTKQFQYFEDGYDIYTEDDGNKEVQNGI